MLMQVLPYSSQHVSGRRDQYYAARNVVDAVIHTIVNGRGGMLRHVGDESQE